VSWHIRVIKHADLSGNDVAAMRILFDREYLSDFGPWTPEAPYGYSPAGVHTLISDGSGLIAHVGFQVRVIDVGGDVVAVAGTGGVLVDESRRGTGLGRQAMQHAQQAMRDESAVEFGYLGCREQVVPFYQSTGWHRIYATERHASRLDLQAVVTSTGSPLLIHPVRNGTAEWPTGDIDLRGAPW
jgi:aminoglycoside 2'-N-acetyltransferase I